MDYCMVEETSKGLSEYLLNVLDWVNESKSMNRKFELSFTRNMFSGSNIEYCIVEWTLKRVNEYVWNVQDWRLFGIIICSVGQIRTTLCLMKHKKALMSVYNMFKIE